MDLYQEIVSSVFSYGSKDEQMKLVTKLKSMVGLEENIIRLKPDISKKEVDYFFNVLFNFIYESFSLESVTYSGNIKEFRDRVFKNREVGEKTCQLYGARGCEMYKILLPDASRETIQYNIGYEVKEYYIESHFACDETSEYPLHYSLLYNLFITMFDRYGMENLVFENSFENIVLENMTRPRIDDHRGADHAMINLDYNTTCMLHCKKVSSGKRRSSSGKSSSGKVINDGIGKEGENKIMFKDLIDGCFRIKSKKFSTEWDDYDYLGDYFLGDGCFRVKCGEFSIEWDAHDDGITSESKSKEYDYSELKLRLNFDQY